MSQKLLPLIARFFLGLIFLMSGIQKAANFSEVSQTMQAAGLTFQTDFFLAFAIVFLLLGSLMLISGFKIRLGALLLIFFLVPATFAFHSDFNDQNQIIHFMKNIAILGGLLLVISFGGGDLVLSKKR